MMVTVCYNGQQQLDGRKQGLMAISQITTLSLKLIAQIQYIYPVSPFTFQGVFQCCGSSGSSDFTGTGAATHWISNHKGYPCSCCPAFICKDNSTSPNNLHTKVYNYSLWIPFSKQYRFLDQHLLFMLRLCLLVCQCLNCRFLCCVI